MALPWMCPRMPRVCFEVGLSGRYETLTVALAAKKSKGTHSVGTGVPVARGLVLTARHVVCPKGAEPAPVRVRFWHATEPEFRPDDVRGTTGFLDALASGAEGSAEGARGVVWSCATRDAALVAVPHPPSIGVATMSEREPFDRAAWKSEGFPHAAWEAGTPDPVRLSGTSHSRFPNLPRYQVDASIAMSYDGPQRGKEGWQGASGAALFVNGQVLGVLLLRKPNGEGRILQALPMKDLLSDPSFRAVVGIEGPAKRPYSKELQTIMAELPPMLRGRLAEVVGLGTEADDAELAQALYDTPLEQGLSGLAALGTAGNAALVRDIALRFAACRCAPKDADRLRPQIFGETDQGAAPAVATRMGAEFIMAAAEARLPEFERRAPGSAALPSGRYALPVLPEAGCSDGEAGHSYDLDGRLGTDLVESEDWLDEWLNDELGRVFEFPADSPKKKESRRKTLQWELNYRSSPEGRRRPSYYFAEPDPGAQQASERVALRARIARIREVYSQIGAVYIQAEDAHEDFARFRPLLDLLPGESER